MTPCAPLLFALFCGWLSPDFAQAQPTRSIKGANDAFGPPIADEVFLQEVSYQIPSTSPLLAVGTLDGKVFAGSDRGLFELSAQTLKPVPQVSGHIQKLAVARNSLWALSTNAIYRFDHDSWQRLAQPGVVDIAAFGTNFIIATASGLFK